MCLRTMLPCVGANQTCSHPVPTRCAHAEASALALFSILRLQDGMTRPYMSDFFCGLCLVSPPHASWCGF